MESKFTVIKTRNWFFIIFFLLFGIFFQSREMEQFYKIKDLKVQGVTTTATVVEVVKIKLTEREVVEFTVPTGEIVNAILPVGRYLNLGEIVDIVYDPQNPTNASLADFSHFPAAGLVSLFAYLFTFLELFTGFSDKIKTK